MNRIDRIEVAARKAISSWRTQIMDIMDDDLAKLEEALDYNPGKEACELRKTGMSWKDIAVKIDIDGRSPVQNASASARNYAINNGIIWPIGKER